MGIRVKQKGYFKTTLNALDTLAGTTFEPLLHLYGQKGVEALAAATPKDTGKTAESWKFRIDKDHGALVLNWYNTNTNEGANIAILLQYGHIGPGNAYVSGRDYINPAIQPVIKQLKVSIRLLLAQIFAGKVAPAMKKFL